MAKNTEQTVAPVPAPEAVPAPAPAPVRKPAVAAAVEQTVANLKEGAAAAAKAARMPAFDYNQAVKMVQDVNAFNRGTLEAFAKSGQLLVSGTQDLMRQAAESAKASYAEAVAGFKSLAGVKSLKQGVELQASLVQAGIERALTEGNQFAQASLKLAEQVAAPLAERTALALEKMGRRA